jgi:hypothetical protein
MKSRAMGARSCVIRSTRSRSSATTLWLESADQLREDKFYRFNQSLQELFNLVAQLPAD